MILCEHLKGCHQLPLENLIVAEIYLYSLLTSLFIKRDLMSSLKTKTEVRQFKKVDWLFSKIICEYLENIRVSILLITSYKYS